MIYCIWYPSGGFGHFVNSILSLHGENFARPRAKSVEFSSNGNSHTLDLIAPKYTHSLQNYKFNFDDQINYSVLVDNGINDEGEKFRSVFPNACIIKMCYDNMSWPIVAKTMIDKAMESSIELELSDNQNIWASDHPWAERERYFLFLRDHYLRQAWKPNLTTTNWLINDLFDYPTLIKQLNNLSIKFSDFRSLWDQWYVLNKKYFDPVINAQSVIQAVKNNNNIELDQLNSIWEQSVLYYLLWVEFGQEVPHNDYADFFKNTNQIKQWLKI
jgi:hypothetical protein